MTDIETLRKRAETWASMSEAEELIEQLLAAHADAQTRADLEARAHVVANQAFMEAEARATQAEEKLRALSIVTQHEVERLTRELAEAKAGTP